MRVGGGVIGGLGHLAGAALAAARGAAEEADALAVRRLVEQHADLPREMLRRELSTDAARPDDPEI